jgi:hypothetical protein
LVYNANCAPFFGGDFNLFTRTVSHDPSRKSFLGKLVGFAALASLAPRVFAKTVVTSPAAQPASSTSFKLSPDSRAVARRVDSV